MKKQEETERKEIPTPPSGRSDICRLQGLCLGWEFQKQAVQIQVKTTKEVSYHK